MTDKLNKLIVQEQDGQILLTPELETLIEATSGRSQRAAARYMAKNGFPEYLNKKGQPMQARVQRRLKALKELFVERALDHYEDNVAQELLEIERLNRRAWQEMDRAEKSSEVAALMSVIHRNLRLRSEILGLMDAQQVTNNNEITQVTMVLNPKQETK